MEKDSTKFIDLRGYWVGNYGDNGLEIIEIHYYKDKWIAVKMY